MPIAPAGPRLTVRAFAELLELPAYAQVRILQEQKYPKQTPQAFRMPFYAPALAGIRAFHAAGNAQAEIDAARQRINQVKLDIRRLSNHRVLNSFEKSKQYMRQLAPRANIRHTIMVGPVELRLGADFVADDKGVTHTIYYNCRTEKLDPDLARTTLEIAHWVLEQCKVTLDPKAINYVDVGADRVFKGAKRRPGKIKKVQQNAAVIDVLWRSI